MYRYFLSLGLVFLTSCTLPGTQTESTDISENTVPIEINGISMDVPRTWSWVTESHTITPKKGALIMTYISPDMQSGFSNNLVVLRDTLSTIMTSDKYSVLNNLQTQKNYLEYTLKKESIITFADNEVSRVYTFRAKYNENTPVLQYVQTARVCGTSVYLIHFTLTLDKKAELYTKLLESFTCK